MHAFRKLIAVSAAAIVMLASGVPVAHGDSTPSVYTTPGGQISGGRLWNTTCEEYSSDIVRCRAHIWATTVVYRNGRYVQRTGWTFNNLSYLPSVRAAWASNNLGRTNPSWTSAGRQWRTECDTALTGRGGCRSYTLASVIKATTTASGVTYSTDTAWVFNNLVLFSSPTLPPVRTVPGWIIDQSRLSFTGLGPLQVGASMKDLTTLGYLVYPDPFCSEGYGESQSLFNRGIEVRDGNGPKVVDVSVRTAGIRTVDGAQVGMTLGQLKGIHGAGLLLEDKYDIPGDSQVSTAVVRSGGNELVFIFDVGVDLVDPLKDSDVVDMMVARPDSPNLTFDGC